MKIFETIRKQSGFIMDYQMPALIRANRLQPVLVRCGGGRFTCPAQDADHFIKIIERDAQALQKATGDKYAGDYVRDVSLPAGYV